MHNNDIKIALWIQLRQTVSGSGFESKYLAYLAYIFAFYTLFVIGLGTEQKNKKKYPFAHYLVIKNGLYFPHIILHCRYAARKASLE